LPTLLGEKIDIEKGKQLTGKKGGVHGGSIKLELREETGKAGGGKGEKLQTIN